MSSHLLKNNTKLLPAQVAKALDNGTLRIVDTILYSAKPLNSDTTIELMKASDTQVAGITNVNNRKLEANNYMVVTGLRLMTAQVTGTGEAALAAADFSGVLDAQVANGELELKVAGKTIMPRNSNRRFVTGTSARWNNYFALDCPKLIVPQAEIQPILYLNAATTGVAARIELHGVRTIG